MLPIEFRPSLLVTVLTLSVGVFFAAFAVYYIATEFLS